MAPWVVPGPRGQASAPWHGGDGAPWGCHRLVPWFWGRPVPESVQAVTKADAILADVRLVVGKSPLLQALRDLPRAAKPSFPLFLPSARERRGFPFLSKRHRWSASQL